MRGCAIASSPGSRRCRKGSARVAAMVDLMWTAFGAREFKAVLELWMAAANQPDVSWAVWPEARAFDAGNPPLAEQLFPEFAARVPDFHLYVSLLFQALQGMGLVHATLPESPESEALRGQVRALLTRMLRQAFAAEPPGAREEEMMKRVALVLSALSATLVVIVGALGWRSRRRVSRCPSGRTGSSTTSSWWRRVARRGPGARCGSRMARSRP